MEVLYYFFLKSLSSLYLKGLKEIILIKI